MRNKAYIMGTPCSGKSTFIRKNIYRYKSLVLYDHDNPSIGPNDYNPLYKLPPLSCIFGGCHKPNMDEFIYAVVLLEHDVFWKYIESRKKNDPTNGWTELAFTHRDVGYYALRTIAQEYEIPVFQTFERALDYVIKKINNEVSQ